MKKLYSKPEILFESFATSTNIAAGCDLITPMPSYEANCGYPIKGAVIFVEGAQCSHFPQEGLHNGFCYHVPIEDKNLFNS